MVHTVQVRRESRSFENAYDLLNVELFGGALPRVWITLQRHARTYGYFSPERPIGRVDTQPPYELALNPDTFGLKDRLILSTLAHEMVHIWQQVHGMPRRKYHDLQWAAKMKEIGLQPSSTGERGGKETGRGVLHYIVAGGAYAEAFTRLEATGFKLHCQSRQNRNSTSDAPQRIGVMPDQVHSW